MESQIITLLKEYGLDDKENKIYTYLVSRGRLTAYQISKDTKLLRSNSYNVLSRLIDKGFVSELIVDGKKFYFANELSGVIGKLKNKESLLESLIPQVKSLMNKNETKIKYVNTKNSFAQFNNFLLDLVKEGNLTFCYMISNSSELTTTSSKILVKRLLAEVKLSNSFRKINAKAIWDKKYKNDPFTKRFLKLGKNRFLEKLPNKATLFIFDGYVAFLFLDETDSFIEIKNGDIAEEMKSYFEYLWIQAK